MILIFFLWSLNKYKLKLLWIKWIKYCDFTHETFGTWYGKHPEKFAYISRQKRDIMIDHCWTIDWTGLTNWLTLGHAYKVFKLRWHEARHVRHFQACTWREVWNRTSLCNQHRGTHRGRPLHRPLNCKPDGTGRLEFPLRHLERRDPGPPGEGPVHGLSKEVFKGNTSPWNPSPP